MDFQKEIPAFGGKNLLSIFKTNPKAMVSAVSKLDPAAVGEIVGMLHDLLVTSEGQKQKLLDEVNDREMNLGRATSTHNAIIAARDEIEAHLTEVEGHLVTTDSLLKIAKQKLDTAQGELDDLLPGLDSEQETLKAVIELLIPFLDGEFPNDGEKPTEGYYYGCNAHNECGDEAFCNVEHSCSHCSDCHWNSYSIDHVCPDKCPVLCEDNPPQPDKCPLCGDQQECEELMSGGLEEEEEGKDWPHCEDGSGRCPISDECIQTVVEYQQNLEAWFMQLFMGGATEMPPLSEWPAAGHEYCECISVQADCVLENKCYDDKMFEEHHEEEQPFTMQEFCTTGMKCEAEHHCEWAEAFNPQFLMKSMTPASFHKFH